MTSAGRDGTPAAPPRFPAAALRVRLDRDVLVRDRGRLLVGGAPTRLMRLSAPGAEVVRGWRAGAAVGEDPGRRALASRLIETGMLIPEPSPRAAGGEVAIVVPAHGRVQALGRCLAALERHCREVPVLVVDDGSPDGAVIRALAEARSVRVERHERCRGPAAARNAGLAATTAPLVAFVDSDVVVEARWLERLLGHFDDPRVGAAAPRIGGFTTDDGPLARYQRRHSSLDMGSRSGPVSLEAGIVPYVPSTTLVVRRAAAGEGFDEALWVGEDVDFVWRLGARGWRVVYAAESSVGHEQPSGLGRAARRRWQYARSIGPLARRHPESLPAVRVEAVTALALALAVLGFPAAGGVAAGVRAWRIRRLVAHHSERPSRLAIDLTLRQLTRTAAGGGRAARRAWAPALLAGACRSRRARRIVLAAAAARLLEPDPPAPRDVLADALDDLIAAGGTWAGCLENRTIRPLLPAVVARRRLM